MVFQVVVDTARWRRHQDAVAARYPGLVPMAKGNGYGVGNARLAAEAARLGVATLAVGTLGDLGQVRAGGFASEVLVTVPWQAGDREPAGPVVRTVSSLAALAQPPGPYVLEALTAMSRYGIGPAEREAAFALLTDPAVSAALRGLSAHLPLDRPPGYDPLSDVREWLSRLQAGRDAPLTLFVSHLRPAELGRLAAELPDVVVRPRVGTELWLGDPEALSARSQVTAVHPVRRGQRVGYRQRMVARDGHLVVVGAGTAHGVALEAPRTLSGALDRAKALGLGVLAAAGRNLSPFSWAGQRLWFAEPPHMQASLVLTGPGVVPPAVGTWLDTNVRLTIVTADEVLDR